MSDLLNTVKGSIAEMIESANALAAKIGAATTDRAKLVHEYLNPDGDAQDETIAKFIEWRDAALAKIEENEAAVRKHIESTYLGKIDESEVDTLKVEYREAVKGVKAARKYYGVLPGAKIDDLTELPELKTLRGTGGGGGTGTKRPRIVRAAYRVGTKDPWTEVSRTVTNAAGEDEQVVNFTTLAQELSKEFGGKVEVKDLQAAAFDAAGTDDLSTLEGKVFEFATTANDTTVFIQVQPAG